MEAISKLTSYLADIRRWMITNTLKINDCHVNIRLGTDHHQLIMYADDTTLSYCVDTLQSNDKDSVIYTELSNVNN